MAPPGNGNSSTFPLSRKGRRPSIFNVFPEPDIRLTLDLNCSSEFPSLSGAPRNQQQANTSQAKWGNPGLRNGADSLNQRSLQAQAEQQILPTRSTPQPPQPPQSQTQPVQDPIVEPRTSPFPQLGGDGADYRFHEQGQEADLTRRLEPAARPADDFPPLGGLAGGSGDIGQGRRTGPVGNVNGSAFGASLAQARASTHESSAAPGGRLASPPGISSRSQLSPTGG